MALPHLEHCCCGCSLKTGTKIIGWLSVILSTILLLITILLGVFNMELMKEAFESKNDVDTAVLTTVVAIVTIIIAIFVIISIIFDVVLLVGVYNDRPGFIHAWIIFETIVIVSSLISTVSSIGGALNMNFINLLGFGLSIYSYLVVNSHHNNLKQRIATAPPFYEI